MDGGTASSSEIVSGALQDAGRAKVIGTKTFGTGTVLGEFPLSDGSALRVGTVEWLTPSGREIWHHGITPDDVVERPSDVDALVPDDLKSMTPAQVDTIKDPQVAEAIKAALRPWPRRRAVRRRLPVSVARRRRRQPSFGRR